MERFEITHFGVMKHLEQLEEAGLVVGRRRGREKLTLDGEVQSLMSVE